MAVKMPAKVMLYRSAVCLHVGEHLSYYNRCVLAGEGEGLRLVTIALDGAM